MSHLKGFPDLPPIWWASTIALIYLAKWAFPALHFEVGVLVMTSRFVLVAALALIAWSAIWFWFKKTPIEPHNTPKTLIVEGPYRLTRNPIYLALVMLTVSTSMSQGSVFGLICALLLWFVLDRRFAEKEEVLLLQTFMAEAADYLQKTRRWL